VTRIMVNVEAVSWLRQHQESRTLDPVGIATVLESGGAQGIACAMPSKPDDAFRRDAWLLKEVVTTHFNVVLRPSESAIRSVLKLMPAMVTLVSPEQSGSHRNAGLPVHVENDDLNKWIPQLRSNNIVVSAFIKPNLDHVKAAARIGVDYVELDAREYADAADAAEEQTMLDTLADLAVAANKLGLGVSAGNGLTYDNVAEVAHIPHMESVHVGTAVVGRGLVVGAGQAVRDMVDVIHRS
jgi:pyridoxine 5-phosphate synthase